MIDSSTTAGADAFEDMLREHGPMLARMARRYSDANDWQDLLQEMRLQLWRSCGSWDGRAQHGTWVYRVALNTALSHVRKPRRRHESLDEVPEPGCAGDPRDPMAVLDAFLATLDPVQRSILLLDLEGLDREQIADVTGISANAVAIRMTRLRQSFEKNFMGEAS
ncbi:MAG: sigma-70 family RNA polymerase sigma factor [Luteimonas sp.]|nr:sigma-70 family RNA polymerase sigma factor [Luteimonas sp.]